MFEAKEVKQNTVSAKGQLENTYVLQFYDVDEAELRVLFVGNSITYHGPNEKIGWPGSWGMAASCREKDYVHQTVNMLNEEYRSVGYAIAQVSDWEVSFDKLNAETWQEPYLGLARFQPDVVVIRLGENIESNKLDYSDLPKCIEEMIEFFGRGARQIVVTDCFWKREKLDNIMEEICKQKGYTFCKVSDLYVDQKTMAKGQFEHQGVAAHPSDYGMELIAKRIFMSIEKKESES